MRPEVTTIYGCLYKYTDFSATSNMRPEVRTIHGSLYKYTVSL